MTGLSVIDLADEISRLFAQKDADRDRARSVFAHLRAALSTGQVRAAEPDPSTSTGWKVNKWVKRGILLGFRAGRRCGVFRTPVRRFSTRTPFP